MQILEQLAFGQNISTMDVVSECSAVIGYLECMNDHATFGVMETVVMEGFDPKAIFTKLWGFIKGIFTKIGQMINKLIGFVRGRKGKLKQKEPASADNNNNVSGPSDGGTKDESSSNDSKNNESTAKDGDVSRPNSTARIGMKSKDELMKEVFEKYPYSGVFPGAINLAFQSMATFSNETLRSAITFSGEGVYGAKKLMSVGADNGSKRRQYTPEYLGEDLADILELKNRGTQYIINKIADVRSDGWEILKGKLKSPQDFKNVANIFYEYYRKENERTADFSNKVFNYSEFEHLVDRYNIAVADYSKYCDSISQNLVKNNERVQDYIKTCNDVMKSLDRIKDVDQKLLSDGFNAVSYLLNTTAQCISYTAMGISTLYGRAESDLNVVGSYIDNVNAKLKSI